jgi:hypothetical protein
MRRKNNTYFLLDYLIFCYKRNKYSFYYYQTIIYCHIVHFPVEIFMSCMAGAGVSLFPNLFMLWNFFSSVLCFGVIISKSNPVEGKLGARGRFSRNVGKCQISNL